jgi:hypothetical protein
MGRSSKPVSPGQQGGRTKAKKEKEREVLVLKARDDFVAILRERKQVEMEAAIPQPPKKFISKQSVQDIDELKKLLKVRPEQRTHPDLVLIGKQIRQTGIFEKLFVSADQEDAFCRILQCRVFLTKGATVVHEGQTQGAFYLIVEGCLVVLASRQKALEDAGSDDGARSPQSPKSPRGEKYVLIANIVEALSVAAADQSGTSDPFVTVTCGTVQGQTTVKKETLNPIWDETIRMHDIDVKEEKV